MREEITSGLPLTAAARLGGHYRFVESMLFRVVGRRSSTMVRHDLQIFCAEFSLECGQHAEWFEERLPRLAGVDRQALTKSPGPLATQIEKGLIDAAKDDVAFVTMLLTTVLDPLIETYRDHRARFSPITDGPLKKTVDLVLLEKSRASETAHRLLGIPLANETADGQKRDESKLVIAWPKPPFPRGFEH